MTLSPLANGYILGCSVAWPPGPIHAEMIRRGLLPKDRGGGFWSTWPIGFGACTGDFIWAFGFSHRNRQAATEAIAVVMLWFAIRLLLHFP